MEFQVRVDQIGYLDGVEEIMVTAIRTDARFNAVETATGVLLYGIPLNRFKSEKKEDINGTS